jgi:hypothetical protein
MDNQREAGGVMFIKRPFPKIQFLLEGIKERVWRHIHSSHIIFGNVELRGDGAIRSNRNPDTSNSRNDRPWESPFLKR